MNFPFFLCFSLLMEAFLHILIIRYDLICILTCKYLLIISAHKGNGNPIHLKKQMNVLHLISLEICAIVVVKVSPRTKKCVKFPKAIHLVAVGYYYWPFIRPAVWLIGFTVPEHLFVRKGKKKVQEVTDSVLPWMYWANERNRPTQHVFKSRD